ncbi:hypothetical protein AVEN_241143-1 [Araneus ventricosus]|uniref:DUF4817 domain-containing protein n=1 Tax=Araneus ventricosus TaxID=182803 RepID=A0A4Y2N732_ARAVE|nr:hypothetical protein AVEN_241143-1 [Araneus ventricosus]
MPQEKAQFVAWFIKTKFDIQVQRNFRIQYGIEPPPRPTIRAWYTSLLETGSVLHKQGPVTHLFQRLTLLLGIGLWLYELGYTPGFLLWRQHFSLNLRHLENKETV